MTSMSIRTRPRVGKGLKGNQREGVLDPGEGLDVVGHEMADIRIVG